jgi:hypothetical protein
MPPSVELLSPAFTDPSIPNGVPTEPFEIAAAIPPLEASPLAVSKHFFTRIPPNK